MQVQRMVLSAVQCNTCSHTFSSCHHHQLAAERYAKYWNKRIQLFGPQKAFEPLFLHEALSEDQVALEIGYLQFVVHGTDAKGRAIVYMNPAKFDPPKYARESMVRAAWYFLHAALEDEAAQKHGVLLLDDPREAKLCQLDRKLVALMMTSIQGVLPIRLAAMYVCRPPPVLKVVFPIVKLFLSESAFIYTLAQKNKWHASLNKILEFHEP